MGYIQSDIFARQVDGVQQFSDLLLHRLTIGQSCSLRLTHEDTTGAIRGLITNVDADATTPWYLTD